MAQEQKSRLLTNAMMGSPAQTIRRLWQFATSRWKARHCTSVGAWVRVEGKLIVDNQGTVRLDQRVRIRGKHVAVELASFPGGSLQIGARTFINSGTSICAQQAVTIGADCAIGNYSLIMDTDFHRIGDLTHAPEARPVVIEDHVWIASRVTVLKGVRIGRGAVVAAGAVVTRDVAPYTLVGGVPARFIRDLVPDVAPETRQGAVQERTGTGQDTAALPDVFAHQASEQHTGRFESVSTLEGIQ